MTKKNITFLGGPKNLVTYGVVIVAYVVLQILGNAGLLNNIATSVLIPICAYIVMAISLNLTVGVLGELSLGHAGFMSVGAFAGSAVVLSLKGTVASAPLRLLLGMLAGALLAGIVGFLIGIPVLRLNGDYLAIVTLAFGEIIKSIFNNLYLGIDGKGLHMSLVNDRTTAKLAEDGRMLISGPMGVGGNDRIATFTAGFLLILVTLFLVFNFVNSRAGRAVMAIRDNRIAAESVGVNITKYKMIAFVISSALAGAAGTLYAMNFSTFVANKFDFNTSILVLVFVVLGGLGNMLGSIIAATILTVLPEALRSFRDYRMLIYAVVLILLMLFNESPAFAPLKSGLKNALSFRRKKTAAGADAVASSEKEGE